MLKSLMDNQYNAAFTSMKKLNDLLKNTSAYENRYLDTSLSKIKKNNIMRCPNHYSNIYICI